ncbi:restriction endonuclease subunit S [Paucibacter sp. KBW04]|nr:restriction endonuclease subunit S [Paucibacter sp. KBW04]
MCTASLGQNIKVLSGFAFPSEGFNQLVGLPLIRIRDLASSDTEVRFKGRYDPTYLIKKGDVLIGMDGDFEVHRWTGEIALLNQRVCKVEAATRELDQRFLYWYLKPRVAEIHRRTPQTTVRHLSASDLYLIPMPPISADEQAAVSQVLDTLDTAIHETEAIIAKLKAVKQGLLHDLLTRGIAANGELRPPQAEAPHLYKESPLGWIPKEWEVESVTKVCSDVVDCPHSTPNYQDQGVLVARTMHIKDGIFLETLASRVSERQYQDRIARLEPQAGDVIFTREAPVGEAFVIPLGMRICLGQRVMLLRPKNGRLVAQYLLAQIYSGAVKDRIATLTSGTTNPHLNVSEAKEFEIPLPPFAEQQEIAKRLNEHESRLQSEISEQKKHLLLKSGLMDDLLTGRVRVTPLLAEAALEQGSA